MIHFESQWQEPIVSELLLREGDHTDSKIMAEKKKSPKIQTSTKAFWILLYGLLFLIWLSQLQSCCFQTDENTIDLTGFEQGSGFSNYLSHFQYQTRYKNLEIQLATLDPLIQSPLSSSSVFPLLKLPLEYARILTFWIEPDPVCPRLYAEVIKNQQSIFTQELFTFDYGSSLELELDGDLLTTTVILNDFAQIMNHRIEADRLKVLMLFQAHE